MSKSIFSSDGNYRATFGRSKDGTYSVTTYSVGDEEYADLEMWIQRGFQNLEEAKDWAVKDLEQSVIDNDEAAA